MRGLAGLRVELDRLRTRRGVVLVLAVAALLTAVLAVTAVHATRPVDATEQAAAEEQLGRQVEAGRGEVRTCLADPPRFFGEEATRADCRALRPSLDWFLDRPTLSLERELDGRGLTLLVLLTGMAVLVGAIFSGADWATGSLGQQLMLTPRRRRVWLTKAAAVGLGATGAALVLLVAYWGVIGAFLVGRGLESPGSAWTDVALTGLRGLLLVAAAAVGSYALTMLLRHTVGTLGLLFGYAVAGEALAASLPWERMGRWSVAENVVAWIQGGAVVRDPRLCDPGEAPCSPVYTLGAGHAAAYLGALLLVAAAASLWSFLRRDVP